MSAPHRRLLAVGAFTFAGAVTVVLLGAACGSFAASEEEPGTAEAGSSEGSATTEGGATTDGGAVVEAGGGPCAAQPCVLDFEDGKLPAGWAQVGNNASLAVTAMGSSLSGTHSLGVTLAAGGSPAYLALDLEGARRAVVTAHVLVVKSGDGEVDFVGISNVATAEPGLYLVHSASLKGIAVELPSSTAQLTGQPFTSYTAVRLEVDLANRSYAYQLGTSPPKLGKLEADAFNADRLFILLGAPYADKVTQAWSVRFDDVKVETF